MKSRLTFWGAGGGDESQYHVQRGGLYREGIYSKMLFMNSMFTGSQCSYCYYYYYLLSHEGTVIFLHCEGFGSKQIQDVTLRNSAVQILITGKIKTFIYVYMTQVSLVQFHHSHQTQIRKYVRHSKTKTAAKDCIQGSDVGSPCLWAFIIFAHQHPFSCK